MPSEIAPVPVDGDYVTNLARELIRIPAENPPGDCSGIADRILSELKSLGVDRIETQSPLLGHAETSSQIAKSTSSPQLDATSPLRIVSSDPLRFPVAFH